jgi:hypothetical protein
LVLQPKEEVTVVIQREPVRDLLLVKGWGFDVYLLGDKSDVVSLRNPLGAPVACDSWGSDTRCPSV